MCCSNKTVWGQVGNRKSSCLFNNSFCCAACVVCATIFSTDAKLYLVSILWSNSLLLFSPVLHALLHMPIDWPSSNLYPLTYLPLTLLPRLSWFVEGTVHASSSPHLGSQWATRVHLVRMAYTNIKRCPPPTFGSIDTGEFLNYMPVLLAFGIMSFRDYALLILKC